MCPTWNWQGKEPAAGSRRIGYPRISRRLQALMIDGLIVPISAIGALILAPQLGLQGVYAAGTAALVVFMLEPFLVSVTGGTLAHHLLGLRVVNRRSGGNIGIFAAGVRFLAKTLLGLFSLASILLTKQHQAIHDVLVGSLVVLKHPEQLPAHEVLGERRIEQQEHGYLYPSRARRILMIVIYNVLGLLAIAIVSASLISERCGLSGRCSSAEDALNAVLSVLWIAGVVASIVLGWQGRLIGSRRRMKGL